MVTDVVTRMYSSLRYIHCESSLRDTFVYKRRSGATNFVSCTCFTDTLFSFEDNSIGRQYGEVVCKFYVQERFSPSLEVKYQKGECSQQLGYCRLAG